MSWLGYVIFGGHQDRYLPSLTGAVGVRETLSFRPDFVPVEQILLRGESHA